MTNLLAIDSSGSTCSVCLIVDGNRFSRTEHVDRRHNELLLPMLSEVREAAGLDERQLRECLDVVAFGRGPGSFTGGRIAAAAAQAIALASGSRIVRVSSSEALAEKYRSMEPASPGVVTLIRSRRDLYYLATYRVGQQGVLSEQSDRLHDESPAASWYQSHSGWGVAGETPAWWRGQAAAEVSASAEQIADVAERMLEQGEGVDAMYGLPEYLEGDAPWKKQR